jgi:acetyl-CoA carboxylase biotin carboxyl carrier protein
MDIKEIQNLIKFVAKSGASEVKLEMEDVKITIKTGPGFTETTYVQSAPVQQSSPQQVVASSTTPQPVAENLAPVAKASDNTSNYITVKSPIIGTFYRRPSPDKQNFVEVGTEINSGDVVCVIEAMKLFNEIESEISGKVVKILVDNASPVEFDQPLFLVDPS